ncbi:23S rRNA (guanine745-N1)-methyltransferase [Thermosporothrix hazakensis]|jgi:23S rRNA (guanine745-N1)-methyltransferase|uniref:23S rRNA (Guanine745-N1)-methyltransferase n=2 Tax=Thermosporothrix TaxID=768650 RepID=A0A326U6A8_THEHA|nr:methyltransferase domain-containing protein [Thermosporothrix hazakensis]PZW25716.1 23S rRNA (guanine745-N1)-methyltransferase [Thermosporothrix hazakensis]BBH90010.1 23S rRNA (guanine(745)-N(1))-methyltransferase [Thermosporothrix sp. COM3]GCE48211.1 23S rRNA (guanine(745)-N(1))-methyltransferase [Thermosporothrix hazakensis]
MDAVLHLLRCPICVTELTHHEKSLRCVHGHSFDIAREGYVNLLRKKAGMGDSKEMLQARRAFLEEGYYAPLVKALHQQLESISEQEQRPLTMLDAGCGTGYYLAHLQAALHTTTLGLGFDISKEAIRLAARQYRETFFFVANVKEHLVLADNAINILLNIFAPRNIPEFARVLVPGGLLAIVIPGEYHLQELRDALHLLSIEEQKRQHILEQCAPYFQLEATQEVTYRLSLPHESLLQLLMMTPNYHHLNEEQYRAIRQSGSQETTADFLCLILRKR